MDSGSSTITKENHLERGQISPSLMHGMNDGTGVKLNDLKQSATWEATQDFFLKNYLF
jgi:hypothetical protein